MAHFTYRLDPDGMVVQAVLGLNGHDTAALVQAGQPIPRPVAARALIDTGTDTTAVAASVFQRLGLAPLITASSQTASGLVSVNLYRISLTISFPTQAAATALTIPDLLVSELTSPLSVEALIGMDVLRQGLLVLDGPGQHFILGF